MDAMASQITSLTIFYSTFIQAQIRENIVNIVNSPIWGPPFSIKIAQWKTTLPLLPTDTFIFVFFGQEWLIN